MPYQILLLLRMVRGRAVSAYGTIPLFRVLYTRFLIHPNNQHLFSQNCAPMPATSEMLWRTPSSCLVPSNIPMIFMWWNSYVEDASTTIFRMALSGDKRTSGLRSRVWNLQRQRMRVNRGKPSFILFS